MRASRRKKTKLARGMDDLNIEQGKIMQLYGLSEAQWNGCIVDVGKRFESDTIVRYSCEVVLGENKGKLLAIKRANLMDIPALTAKERACARSKYDRMIDEFDSTDNIDERWNMANEIISAVPHEDSIWYIIANACKFYRVAY